MIVLFPQKSLSLITTPETTRAPARGHLIVRVIGGGPTLFRSNFSDFLSALGLVFPIFLFAQGPHPV